MRKGGGKQKGNSFERKVCKQISLWWSAGKYNDLCWRSASSGAVGTVTRTKTKAYHADLTAVSPLIEPLFEDFSIEVKHYKTLDITEVLRDIKIPKLISFWNQARKSALLSNRHPVLIYKTNYYPELIVLTSDFLEYKALFKVVPKYLGIGNKLVVLNFNTLLNNLNREKFIQWQKRGLFKKS